MTTMLVEGRDEHRERLRTQWDAFGETTRCLLAARAMFEPADYVRAQQVRAEGRRLVRAVFDDLDLVIHPTAATAAPSLDDADRHDSLTVIHTMCWSALGNPAISTSMGRNAAGLPVGLHVAARPADDHLPLRLASAFQDATSWHLHLPFEPGRAT